MADIEDVYSVLGDLKDPATIRPLISLMEEGPFVSSGSVWNRKVADCLLKITKPKEQNTASGDDLAYEWDKSWWEEWWQRNRKRYRGEGKKGEKR